ncbi:MAG: hypothetical protein C0404_11210 [Verrucomicrobia bacterium]|nr:hypothetical protein [Verrucomicrobiota bacterium]
MPAPMSGMLRRRRLDGRMKKNDGKNKVRPGKRSVRTERSSGPAAEEVPGGSGILYRDMVEKINDVIFVVDGKGVVTYVSPAVTKILGYAPQDLVGRTYADLIHEEDRPDVVKSFVDVLAGNLYPSEFRIRSKSGEMRWVRTSSHPIVVRRRAAGICGVLTDMTLHRCADQLLRDSEERYRALVEEQVEAVCRWLPDTTLTYVNESYCRYFGKSREELIGYQWISLVPEETRESTRQFYRKLAMNPARALNEHKVIATDGSVRWQEWIDTPILDAEGRLIEFQSVGRDTTERKNTEKNVRDSEIFWRTLVENSPTSFARIGKDGKFVFVNRQFCEWSGMKHEDVIGCGPERLAPFLSPEVFACMVKSVQETIEHKARRECELHYILQDGRELWIAQISYPWFDADGCLLGVEVLGYDITLRKQAEAEISRHQKELETSEKELRQFASKILSVREEEKRKLSAVLHHEAGSLVVGMSAQLVSLEDAVKSNNGGDALSVISEMRSSLRDVAKSLKSVAIELRPPDLELLGLTDALKAHLSRLTSRSKVKVSLVSEVEDELVPPGVGLVIFRVAQEALNNVLLHAQANNVNISMKSADGRIRLRLRDDGRGFDPQEVSYTGPVRIGLRAMREMVTSRGGTFLLKSARQEGCEIVVSCPLVDTPDVSL